MLTPRQNLLETIRGGNPDRYVNQFEFFAFPWKDPYNYTNPAPYFPGDENRTDMWGVTWAWPEGTPGMFPVHKPGFKVIEDIEEWEGPLTVPPVEFPDEMWEEAKQDYAQYDRNEIFVGPIMFPGLFEQTHCLMGMDDALMAFYTEPEKMHEIIGAITDWYIAYMQELCRHVHPDAVLQHDDWGSSSSTFLSPEMFREFYLEPYKRLYKCYKDNGIQVIIHHCDCYAATYVPMMIEMGIDIWQGGTIQNDIPALIKEYGGKISFMTAVESSDVDKADWTKEDVRNAIEKACDNCGKQYFIPSTTQGGAVCAYEGVYEAISEAINTYNREKY